MKYFLRLLRDPDPEGVSGGDSITVGVDQGAPPAGDSYTPPEIDMATALPPELRDKPYFKDKDFVSLVKEFDNAQKLIGSRPAGIPTADSSPEEWDKFLGALKPKDVGVYQLPETEYSKAGKRTEAYEKEAKEAMFEIGVPPQLASKIFNWYENKLVAAEAIHAAAAEEKAQARETEFEGLLDKTFGQTKQQVLDRVKPLMDEAIPEEHRELVDGVLKDIPNDALFAMTLVLDGLHKKYIGEDTPPGDGAPSSQDVAVLQREAEELMKSAAYRDFRQAGHEDAKAKVQELFKKIASAKKN